MNRLVALLRPPPKTPSITGLDGGQPAPRGARARLRHITTTIAVFLRPRWLAFHLLVWAAAVTMVLLGRWQLDVSNDKHFDLQNFSYTLQWWAFAAFALFLWFRVMQYHLHPPAPPESGTGLARITPGQLAPIGPTELVASGGESGQEPVVYRGYVMPQASDRLVRSHGDSYHDVYNDYLWQLSLADGVVPRSPSPASQSPSAAPQSPSAAAPTNVRPPADLDETAGPAVEAPRPNDLSA